MINFQNKYRSEQVEHMDSFELKGEEMKKVLSDIKNVNKWLGGNSITLQGIKKLLKNKNKKNTYTIVDVGCGDGEMLRQCHSFGLKNGYKFLLIGLDFNPHIIENARKKSDSLSNISFEIADVFSDENVIPQCDIALSTLFIHHFKNPDIVLLLRNLVSKASVGVVVNDLHRSRLAFWLFKIISPIIIKTNTAKEDGLISIARGFKKKELMEISQKIHYQITMINWIWAFRYQLILKKNG